MSEVAQLEAEALDGGWRKIPGVEVGGEWGLGTTGRTNTKSIGQHQYDASLLSDHAELGGGKRMAWLDPMWNEPPNE